MCTNIFRIQHIRPFRLLSGIWHISPAICGCLNCTNYSDNSRCFPVVSDLPNVNVYFAFSVDLSHFHRTPVWKPHYVKWRNLGIFLWIMWITLCITNFPTFFIPFSCGKTVSFSTVIDSVLFLSTYFLCNFHNLPFFGNTPLFSFSGHRPLILLIHC